MIRLANPNEVYTSPSSSHTVKTGVNYDTYYLNHGLSREPDKTTMYIYDSIEDVWVEDKGYYNTSGTVYGAWAVPHTDNTKETVTLRVYRLSGVTETIRFKCFVFNFS